MIVKTINYHGQQLSKIMEDKQLKILGSINVRDVNYHAYQQRAKDLRYATSTSFCASYISTLHCCSDLCIVCIKTWFCHLYDEQFCPTHNGNVMR